MKKKMKRVGTNVTVCRESLSFASQEVQDVGGYAQGDNYSSEIVISASDFCIRCWRCWEELKSVGESCEYEGRSSTPLFPCLTCFSVCEMRVEKQDDQVATYENAKVPWLGMLV